MAGLFSNKSKRVNDRRRENKMRLDYLKKGTFKHEVNHVFNTFYRDQVAALYREITRSKSI